MGVKRGDETAHTGRLAGWNRGATRLGLVDVIVVLIVLAILLWASWKQFPAYRRPPAPIPAVTPAPFPATRHGPGFVPPHIPIAPQ